MAEPVQREARNRMETILRWEDVTQPIEDITNRRQAVNKKRSVSTLNDVRLLILRFRQIAGKSRRRLMSRAKLSSCSESRRKA